MRERPFSAETARVAKAMWDDGDYDGIATALHDALAEDGHEALAVHFADPTAVHKMRSPGPGQCWAMLFILGRLPRRRELLGTPTAAEWLGVSAAKFRKLAEKRELQPEETYRNEHYKSGPPCPLWAPEDVVTMWREMTAGKEM